MHNANTSPEKVNGQDQMQQILNVVVVGFHHKKGCQIEYSHPPLTGSGEFGLPEEWSCLPSLAIPDGSHNTTEDTVYFTLPSPDEPGIVVFGISCYRQIPTKDLISREKDVCRNTVQKSVCIISKTPLYGVLKAKLQLITQAYFNERDFSRVDVLSHMFDNLCDMFTNYDLVDGQAASMDIPICELFRIFRHRAVLLFKLLLLEKRVFFFITPAQLLGDIILSLISLFPRVLEEGLQYSSYTTFTPPIFEVPVTDEDEMIEIGADDVLKYDPFRNTDTFGFPMSIFTKGNSFLPYISLPLMDTIKPLRAFVAGATNALFVMKKESFDAVITINEGGVGNVELITADLKKNLFLTSADLRFGDYVLKNMDTRSDPSIFEGGDEWIRLQMQNYLLFLISSSRSGLSTAVGDFGSSFVAEWKTTNNYRVLTARPHDDLASTPPGHPFAGQIGLADVFLRVEHNVSGSRNARKALTAISATGKNIGETGSKMKTSLSNWLKGGESAEGSSGEGRSGWFKSASTSAIVDDHPQKSSESSSDQDGLGSRVKSLTSWWKRDNSATAEAKEAKNEDM